MIRGRLRQHQSEKVTQRERIGCPPPDRALRVQAFEIADQQQPEVAPGWQPRSTLIGVEWLAEPFDVTIEVVLIEDLIEPCVEWMSGAARQILCGAPHRRL